MTPPVVHNQCPGVEYNQLVSGFDSVSIVQPADGLDSPLIHWMSGHSWRPPSRTVCLYVV